jgi:hypothetical protein
MYEQIQRKKNKNEESSFSNELTTTGREHNFPIDESRASLESQKFIKFNKNNPVMFFHDQSDSCFPNFEILEDKEIKEEFIPMGGHLSKSKSHQMVRKLMPAKWDQDN